MSAQPHGAPTIGIDIGGTTLRAAVVDEHGSRLAGVRTATPKDADALDAAIIASVQQLRREHEVSAVGLAVAGFVDEDRRTVRFAPHLPWRESAVPERLGAALGLPVVMEHDANAAALAEHRFGAAAGGRNVVLIAIGTGIGAGLISQGAVYRGSFGVAPELGHLQVVPHGRACPCGKRGCWERYCSGTALVETALDRLSHSAHGPLADQAREDPRSLSGKRIAVAAENGEPLALEVVADFAQWLGVGLSLVADVFDPDLIVIGGGVSASAPLFLDLARERYAELSTGGGYRPRARVRGALLGDAAGIVGAAELARGAGTARR